VFFGENAFFSSYQRGKIKIAYLVYVTKLYLNIEHKIENEKSSMLHVFMAVRQNIDNNVVRVCNG